MSSGRDYRYREMNEGFVPVSGSATTGAGQNRFNVIGTDLLATDYRALAQDLIRSWRMGEPRTLSFCNTFMVTLRRINPAYRAVTRICDTSLPDGMPLVWCMNLRGARMRDRVYGPIFMERFLASSPAQIRHYFLGGDARCLELLFQHVLQLNPQLNLVGSHHGYFSPDEESGILREIQAVQPDFVWVGLGTPKQDEWVARHRAEFARAILLPVGSSFEILAGTKPSPPMIFQRMGLTWLFRLCAEPVRLGPRYFKYNMLFLYHVVRDLIGIDRTDDSLDAPPPSGSPSL